MAPWLVLPKTEAGLECSGELDCASPVLHSLENRGPTAQHKDNFNNNFNHGRGKFNHNSLSSPPPVYREEPSVARALAGGVSGAVAMGVNVGLFMWLRTITSFQQVHGTPITTAIKTLYREGGVRRFYQGLMPALVQGPVARFGDTAANTGVLILLDSRHETRDLPILVKTFAGSAVSSIWRLLLMPLDTLLVHKQIEGRDGWKVLAHKIGTKGPGVLYQGAGAAFAGQLFGHFSWFAVYNALQTKLPHRSADRCGTSELGRNAAIGFLATVVSDCLTNAFTVIKCVKQASRQLVSYHETTTTILRTDGVRGLVGRGLSTRLFGSGVQGMTFVVTWKFIDDCFFNNGRRDDKGHGLDK